MPSSVACTNNLITIRRLPEVVLECKRRRGFAYLKLLPLCCTWLVARRPHTLAGQQHIQTCLEACACTSGNDTRLLTYVMSLPGQLVE
jgi:hypothetical protein